jgi:hypothetical protein
MTSEYINFTLITRDGHDAVLVMVMVVVVIVIMIVMI